MTAEILTLPARPDAAVVYATDGADATRERLRVHVPHAVEIPGGNVVKAGWYRLLRRLSGNRLVVEVHRLGWHGNDRHKPKNPPPGPYKMVLGPGQFDAYEDDPNPPDLD